MWWILVVLLVILAPVIWGMISRARRGEKSDDAYNGSSSDAALMEIGRGHHGRMP